MQAGARQASGERPATYPSRFCMTKMGVGEKKMKKKRPTVQILEIV